ncbi:hypothetical protein LCGC14_1551160 [marine sediment metagenome]|uniref:Uncharacterized protein n=1 Tax=marine sediment metagenome TaxID=412755 RepID=A0A0F9JB76_9ZZZZ
MRCLLKIFVIFDNSKGWTLKNSKGEKTFYGNQEGFVTLLKRLKVSDDLSNPRSYRALKYSDIVNGIIDHTSPYIWVWSNIWNKNKKRILNRG